jgi:hypothetical protein
VRGGGDLMKLSARLLKLVLKCRDFPVTATSNEQLLSTFSSDTTAKILSYL